MKKQYIKIIHEMLQQGKNTTEISLVLDIPSSTIRAHIRRHPELYSGKPCRNCGKVMAQPVGRKVKHFCSDKCRMAWWNSHREQVQKKAYYTLICTHCGKEFTAHNDNTLEFTLTDETVTVKRWQDRSRAASWTPEMRAAAGQKTRERNVKYA